MANFVESVSAGDGFSMGTAPKKASRALGARGLKTRQPASSVDADFRKLLEAAGIDAASLGRNKYAFGLPAKAPTRLTPQSLARIAKAFRSA